MHMMHAPFLRFLDYGGNRSRRKGAQQESNGGVLADNVPVSTPQQRANTLSLRAPGDVMDDGKAQLKPCCSYIITTQFLWLYLALAYGKYRSCTGFPEGDSLVLLDNMTHHIRTCTPQHCNEIAFSNSLDSILLIHYALSFFIIYSIIHWPYQRSQFCLLHMPPHSDSALHVFPLDGTASLQAI